MEEMANESYRSKKNITTEAETETIINQHVHLSKYISKWNKNINVLRTNKYCFSSDNIDDRRGDDDDDDDGSDCRLYYQHRFRQQQKYYTNRTTTNNNNGFKFNLQKETTSNSNAFKYQHDLGQFLNNDNNNINLDINDSNIDDINIYDNDNDNDEIHTESPRRRDFVIKPASTLTIPNNNNHIFHTTPTSLKYYNDNYSGSVNSDNSDDHYHTIKRSEYLPFTLENRNIDDDNDDDYGNEINDDNCDNNNNNDNYNDSDNNDDDRCDGNYLVLDNSSNIN